MSRKQKKSFAKKTSPKNTSSSNITNQSHTLFESLDIFFDKHLPKLNVYFTIIFSLLSILSFDPKLSIAFDDAMYMTSAYRYVHDFPDFFHTANAPFYPMVLSILVAIFGFDMLLLKATSVIFMSLGIYFTVKAFYKRLPSTLVFFMLLMMVFNVHFLWYSHHTFTEAFFFMLQGIFFNLFFHFIEKPAHPVKKGIWLGVLCALLYLTRTVAIAAIGSVIFYLILKKDWKKLIYPVVAFLSFIAVFSLAKTYVWHVESSSGQAKILMQKDPYNPDKGMEDFNGFVQRFFDNYGLYVSKRLYDLISLRPDAKETNTGLGFISLILFLVSFFQAFKNKQDVVLFSLIYLSGICFITFVALQTQWDQLRLILPYLPFFIIALLYGLYRLLSKMAYAAQLLLFFILLILPIIGISRTFKMVKENFPVAMKNLKGDRLAGLTPDWQNYVRISIWAAENLPEDAVIACRKAPISAIYSKFRREFFNIHNVPSSDPDSLVDLLKQHRVTHVIVASLRRDPSKKTEHIINTMHRYIGTIQQKYPNFVTLVHQEGSDEPAYLFKVNYPENFTQNEQSNQK